MHEKAFWQHHRLNSSSRINTDERYKSVFATQHLPKPILPLEELVKLLLFMLMLLLLLLWLGERLYFFGDLFVFDVVVDGRWMVIVLLRTSKKIEWK